MDDRGREKGIRDDFSTFGLRSWVVMSLPEMKPEGQVVNMVGTGSVVANI